MLAIDQGTTSTRAILFDSEGRAACSAQMPLTQIYPAPGQVEHDPEEIWRHVLQVGREVLSDVGANSIAAIGITNQRETTVVWERASGKPLANAIVWQDRRTAPLCAELPQRGMGRACRGNTGLVIDPYFSATKLAWLLATVPGLAERARRGSVLRHDRQLPAVQAHRRQAARDRRHQRRPHHALRHPLGRWDDRLLERLGVPRAMLPEVRDSQSDFGLTQHEHFGAEIPIRGVAGDQQAAAYGQACFSPGMLKATFGTGCFRARQYRREESRRRRAMLSTVFHQLEGKRAYALEGAIFMAGATVQWLRDSLGLIAPRPRARNWPRGGPEPGVYLVPAFQGLGAPFWDPGARAAILGMTRAASKADLVAAGLEAVAFQTRDLLTAMGANMAVSGIASPALRVDGGMTANAWLMQRLADILGRRIEVAAIPRPRRSARPIMPARRAGFTAMRTPRQAWMPARMFEPNMSEAEREARYGGWLDAVARVRSKL